MEIVVANYRHVEPPDGTTSVYVARPSALGNPYRIGPDMGREEAIRRYATWLDAELARPDSAAARKFARLLKTLRTGGYLTLVCWCAPEPCHAEVIRDRLLARLGAW